MQQWLDNHPEATVQMDQKLRQAIDQVVEGKTDLKSQLARELAEACALPPSELLDQLAELQRNP